MRTWHSDESRQSHSSTLQFPAASHSTVVGVQRCPISEQIRLLQRNLLESGLPQLAKAQPHSIITPPPVSGVRCGAHAPPIGHGPRHAAWPLSFNSTPH
jgi:hypothetical protein